MDIEKILEMLDVQKLDESKQEEVKNKLQETIDVKVDEKMVEKEKEQKEELVEEYEKKFEEYKQDITEKFSDFLDEVLDEEMTVPDHIKEFARKGELYEDVIEQLKSRIAIDEDQLDGETQDLLKECKTEISSLKEQVNDLTGKNIELEQSAKEFAAHSYLQEKCDGLSPQKKEKAMSILEGVTDKEEINKKFDVIVESTNDTGNNNDNSEEDYSKGKDSGQLNESNTSEGGGNDDPFSKMKNYWVSIMSESK